MKEKKTISLATKRKERTYKATLYCQNCGHQNPVDIPFGICIISVDVKCSACGCTRKDFENAHKDLRGGPSINPNVIITR